MPIKKHIVKVEKNNTITIPQTLCSALGIGEGTCLKVYSNNDSTSFTCSVPFSFENMQTLETYKQENNQLRQKIKQLEERLQKGV